MSTTSAGSRPLLYLYCAVRDRPAAAALAAQPGMPGGAPPRSITLDDTISLVVSDVPKDTYNARTVESRLGDLDWVSAAAAAHHAVIDALVDQHAVLPFRVFTLFSSEASAVAALKKARPQIEQAMARVSGRQEWVLRVFPGGNGPRATALAPATSTPAKSGAAFLKAKAEARKAQVERAARIKADVESIYATLTPLAVAAARRPPQQGETMLLDAAFLIDIAAIDRFRETLTRAAAGLLRDDCRVSFTGPWPPYSFAAVDPDAHG